MVWIPSLDSLLYAVDSVVLVEFAEELQLKFNTLHDYCNDLSWQWTLQKLNWIPSKCTVGNCPAFLFGSAYLEGMDSWEYKIDIKGSDGNVVGVMDNYTYLGRILNHNGSFCKNIDTQMAQGKKAEYALASN